MNKKYWLLSLLIFALLAACSSGSSEEPTPVPTTAPANESNTDTTDEEKDSVAEPDTAVATTTISFAVYDWDTGRYKDMIKAFQEENPDIRVKLVSVNEILDLDPMGGAYPDDANLRLASAADVVNVGVSRSNVEQGFLMDLMPFVEADATFNKDDFYPGLLDANRIDAGLYAIPSQVEFQLIFFNKDAFDAAGLDYPQPGWTWDDLVAMAQELTIREGDEVTQWGFVETYPNPSTFIETRTGPLFNDATEPPTVYLDTPATIDAMRWYTDLFTQYEVAPYVSPSIFEEGDDSEEEDTSNFDLPEGYQLVEDGKAAMWLDYSGSWSYRSQQRNLGVVPFPVDKPDSLSTPIFSSGGYSISAGSQKAEAAWKWLAFLSEQEPLDYGGFGGPTSLAARRTVAAASGFWEKVDEELGAALEFALDHGYQTINGTGFEVYDAVNKASIAIVEEGESVEDALADAQVAVENSFAEGAASSDEATPVPEITVAEPEEETVNPNATEIVFVTTGGVFGMDPYRDLVTQFEEANPDIVVTLEQPNFFNASSLGFPEIAADSDCFEWYPSFEDPDNLAAILNMEPFLDNDATISKDDFFPALMQDFTHQGQVWGLPGTVSLSLVEYNKDLFDAAGIDYPSATWTTDDFLEMAVALTQGDNDETKQYGYVPDMFEPTDMMNMIDRLGAKIIDDSQDPSAFSFTDLATVEAVRWYVNLTTEYQVKPTFMTSFDDTSMTDFQLRETLINEGRAGMWTSSGAIVGLPGSTNDLNTGFAPLPTGPDGQHSGGYQNVSGYFISAETASRQACWSWITFLTENATSDSGLPGRIDTANSPQYRQLAGDDKADAFLASITGATEPSIFQRFSNEDSWMGASFLWLITAYDQILNDGITVEEALANAQDLADTYRACVISQDGFSDDKAQQACMQEADPSLPSYLFSNGDE